ncbi:hypothetical protein MTO96_042456 [Rhipicephalus appendiculatus]
MQTFLGRFVEQLTNMRPIVWKNGTAVHKSRVCVVCCAVDAPARASVLHMVQFNGIHGCPWCLISAQYAEENLLSSFVTRCATLYGVAAATFNVHQILHLAENVRQLGPLWANSAFVFEGGNSKLVKSVTAAHGLPHQIVERVVMGQCLNNLIVSAQVTKQEQSLCLKFLGHKDILDAIEEDGVTLLGRARRARLSDTEINTLRNSSYDASECSVVGRKELSLITFGSSKLQRQLLPSMSLCDCAVTFMMLLWNQKY